MEFVATICDDRKAAPGFRAESWAEGRERREVGADDRSLPHQLGESVPWARVRRPWHSLPRRSRIRKIGWGWRGLHPPTLPHHRTCGVFRIRRLNRAAVSETAQAPKE